MHPNVNLEDIQENTCFELLIPEVVTKTEPPSVEELKLLRTEIDPAGIVIG